MSVFKRGDIWWYVFVVDGRKIQESSGHRNKAAALRAEARRRADLLDRRLGYVKPKLPPKFDEFTKQFLDWSKGQHRPKTQQLHAGNCAALRRYFRGKWLDEITQGMVEDFKTARIREHRWGKQKGSTVSVVTVNRALSTLRLIFNYAERYGYHVTNPMKHVEFFREQGRERIISLEEECAYMATASQPLKDIARTILDTGMRPEEVFRIERANIDLAQRTIVNPFGKTRAARRKLTMTEEVWTILKKRVGSSASKYVFPSPDNRERPIGSVRKAHDGAVRRAKIQPAFRLYDLRHTYASRAVMAGVDLPTLGALLGHTTIQMTMRYVHPAEQHKREAAQKIETFKILSAMKLAEGSQGVTTISTTVQ
jgi:integrase